MKTIILALIGSAFLINACNSKTDKSTGVTKDSLAEKNTHSTNQDTAAGSAFSIKELVRHYLVLKNALTNDNGKEAAAAGKAIVENLNSLDATRIPDEQKKVFTDVAADAIEHAGHIGDNAGKIEHQREHFAMLSRDINDLVKTFDPGQKLYEDFCPMFNNNKGAIWLSETKEIKNPYYGSKMLTCGELKKEL